MVDDGSTEPLPDLPPDVELVRQENQGVARARNNGWRRAETPYVLFLDADDRLVPGALALLRAPLEADPTLGFAYGRMRFFGDWEGELRFPPYDPYALLYRHTIGLSALVRRQLLEDTGGFDPEFRQFEDWELWVNALAHGWRGLQVDTVTVEYRRHSSSKHARGPACVPRSVRSPQGKALGALPRARPPCRRQQPRLVGSARPPRVLGPEAGAGFRRAGPLPLALA